MEKLVSIIMPAYNTARYIQESIKSVQLQKHNKWELLVINDGSQDNTEDIVKMLHSQDNRISLISQQNKGVACARNLGIERARGAYIAFLDSDDVWKPDFLSDLIAAKENMQADAAYCGYTSLYSSGLQRRYSHSYCNGNILMDAINGKVNIHIGTLVVDKKFLVNHEILFTEGCLIGEDSEFVLKVLMNANVVAVPREYMVYRRRPDSMMTSQWDWKQHIQAIESFKRIVETFEKHSNELPQDLIIEEEFHKRLSYKTYKFLWRMIKHGYHQEVLQLMEQEDYKRYLSDIETPVLSKIDSIKYNVVVSKNKQLWKIAEMLNIF